MESPFVCDADTVYRILSYERLVVVDARPQDAFEQGHIPGAVNIPPARLEEDRQLRSGAIVHRLLGPTERSRQVFQRAGIAEDSRVVIYDEGGAPDAARLWWILDYLGHPHIQILDGGLTAWMQDVGELSVERTHPRHGSWHPQPQDFRYADFVHLITSIRSGSVTLCNSLPYEDFAEGAIPGSESVPYTETFENGRYPALKSAKELLELFRERNIRPEEEVVFYCDEGYSAAQNYFAARVAGFQRVRVYDGSIEDWTGRGGDLLPYGGADLQP
ncbi:MAG: sulfurtransferase [Spirochaetaceae bacterium]